jgi:hypothetical protein
MVLGVVSAIVRVFKTPLASIIYGTGKIRPGTTKPRKTP